MRPSIGVVLITKNEEHQIRACLNRVRWADEIVVVDDCSTDRTAELAEGVGATVIVSERTSFSEQRNLGMNHCSCDWILHLDADERVSNQLRDEISATIQDTNGAGFRILYRHFWLGNLMRYGEWRNYRKVRLARRDASYWENTVYEELKVNGPIGELESPLDHYVDRTYSSRLEKSNLYSSLRARRRFEGDEHFSVLRMLFQPPCVAAYRYIWLQGCRDGLPGLIWMLHTLFSEFTVHAKLWEIEQFDAGGGD